MNQPTIFALGFFDGVHLGHQALLRACRNLADAHGALAGAITFGSHPDALVLGRTPRLICTPEDREQILRREFHMDTVVTLPFDQQMRKMPWMDFLDLLRREHGASGFVCGEDFRFGHRGGGNAQLLADYCLREGLPCTIVPDQFIEGKRISSTLIRGLIQDGRMESATKFLGHPYVLTGTVVPGKQLGRKLGVPTANLVLPEVLAVPTFGVYACRTVIDGISYPAVTNIGIRPTVEGHGITVEPWILDFEGDLYGRELRLEFYRFIRPERKFSDLDSLRRAIQSDAEETRAYFDRK